LISLFTIALGLTAVVLATKTIVLNSSTAFRWKQIGEINESTHSYRMASAAFRRGDDEAGRALEAESKHHEAQAAAYGDIADRREALSRWPFKTAEQK